MTDLTLKLGEMREGSVLLDLLYLLAVNVGMKLVFLKGLKMV